LGNRSEETSKVEERKDVVFVALDRLQWHSHPPLNARLFGRPNN
jgi:hypothetical protein